MTQVSLELTAERMEDLADHLDDAVNVFRAWGIRVKETSRLPTASRLLRRVSASGGFPTQETELLRVAAAVRDAQEFTEVARALPGKQLQPLEVDLQQAVRGELGTSGTQAAQHQSQLWVGAMLTSAAARTAVILDKSGIQPDFVVEDGTYRYGVEVKRPAGRLRSQAIVSEAAGQVGGHRYHGGMIVVDLSDCLDRSTAVRVGKGPPDQQQVRDSLIKLSGTIHEEIFDTRSGYLRPRREHVFALVTFGRTVYWDEHDLSRPYLFRFVSSVAYWRRNSGTLRAHRARSLAHLIHVGITAVGHKEIAQVDIDF